MEITAATVKAFRDKTGLPMMECKRALQEANGNEELAIELLRKAGKKTMAGRTDRETEAGRIAVYTDPKSGASAMVELLCESAPVANTDEFIALVNALARQLAEGPGAKTADELLDQPFPGKSATIREEYDDLVNKIREVFKLNRMVRVAASCGTYVHHNNAVGVLVEYEGSKPDIARDVCMHVASMRPKVFCKDDLDQAMLEKERAIVVEEVAQNNAGKPANILEKIVEGRMKTFVAESCLLDQPFVKDPSKTVSQYAADNGVKLKGFIHWVLGQ
ncbi:MAG: translation elongation factor Ts [Planctomycetaceae bacterium]|nr:translation elongation factor Ts [Planctomycetaceae bacterium]